MNWMKQLAQFHQQRRDAEPKSHLILLFHLIPDYENFSGEVFDLLRWFQIQEKTSVGIYSELEQAKILMVLNELNRRGFAHRLTLESDNLYLNADAGSGLASAAVDKFGETGKSVFAVIDPVDKNLEALKQKTLIKLQPFDSSGSISDGKKSIIQGNSIDLVNLISEKGLPKSIQYCWHGINDEYNLNQFLDSSVVWGEVDVRHHPATGQLITRHDSYKKSPAFSGEQVQLFKETLQIFRENNRHVKIDFKQGRSVIDEVSQILQALSFPDEEIWFHGDVHKLYPGGFKKLRANFPGAIIQTTIDGLGQYIVQRPRIAKGALNIYARWGVNRFLLTWQSLHLARIMEQMGIWGYDVNFYEIPDLQSFLHAVLFLPAGITSDYNFPEWNRFGRGSGQDLKWHIYREELSEQAS